MNADCCWDAWWMNALKLRRKKEKKENAVQSSIKQCSASFMMDTFSVRIYALNFLLLFCRLRGRAWVGWSWSSKGTLMMTEWKLDMFGRPLYSSYLSLSRLSLSLFSSTLFKKSEMDDSCRPPWLWWYSLSIFGRSGSLSCSVMAFCYFGLSGPSLRLWSHVVRVGLGVLWRLFWLRSADSPWIVYFTTHYLFLFDLLISSSCC